MAALIQWDNAKYSVKINSIDEQHKKLVALINQLFEAMSKGEAHEQLSAIIQELIQYTETHFGTEEAYFKKFGYDNSVEHENEHKKFVEQIKKFQSDFEAGSVTLSKDIIFFLKDWLINHICGTDQHYTDFLLSKGVK